MTNDTTTELIDGLESYLTVQSNIHPKLWQPVIVAARENAALRDRCEAAANKLEELASLLDVQASFPAGGDPLWKLARELRGENTQTNTT